MRLQGRKLKLGLVLIMTVGTTYLSMPLATSYNRKAPIGADFIWDGYEVYKAKTENLKEEQGSMLTQATMLVYDEILRYQRDVAYTHGLTAELVDEFHYDDFAANVGWFMDELVGMESDWKKEASPGIEGNTAYGYAQFTEESVKTAVNRYIYHINQFNSRSILGRRDWQPRGYTNGDGIFDGTKLRRPQWLIDLNYKLHDQQSGGTVYPATYDHKTDLDALTYDQVCALAFVHLHSKTSKDYNFVQLAKGDTTAAKEIYTRNHHTKPDADTLKRLEKFFLLHDLH